MATGFFDLETKYLFSEVGGRYPEDTQTCKLGLAVAGLIVDDEPIKFYEESEVEHLINNLKKLDTLVGHNVISFDYLVLKPYTQSGLTELNAKTIDTMRILYKKTNRLLGLSHLAEMNFGVKKTEDPLKIPGMWRAGEKEKVKSYLANDVEMVKRLYLHGKNRPIRYLHKELNEIREIQVEW